MKFMLRFETLPTMKNGYRESRDTKYKVSSPVELFDRMVKLRHVKDLVKVKLYSRKPKRNEEGKMIAGVYVEGSTEWLYLSGRYARVKFHPDAMTTMDGIEQVATAIWHVLETYAGSVWDRENNVVPKQLQPYLEKVQVLSRCGDSWVG